MFLTQFRWIALKYLFGLTHQKLDEPEKFWRNLLKLEGAIPSDHSLVPDWNDVWTWAGPRLQNTSKV